MSGVNITVYDSIELHDGKAIVPCLFQTVRYQFFSDMKPSCFSIYSITGVGNMATSSNIIGVKNVHSQYSISFSIDCNAGISLFMKKRSIVK